MDYFLLLVLSACAWSAGAEPLRDALQRRSLYGVYADDYDDEYEPVAVATFPLHQQLSVVPLISHSSLNSLGSLSSLGTTHKRAVPRAPPAREHYAFAASEPEWNYSYEQPEFAASSSPKYPKLSSYESQEYDTPAPVLLYARPNKSGGYTYRRKPARPAAKPDEPVIIRVHKYKLISSEDPEHPADNLLEWEVSKKKWLCRAGEPSCSVVLQLARAVQISAVHIGSHHSALVEVLVGLSEKPNDPFEVVVPSCVFVPPAQCRGPPVPRVRSFSGEQLAPAHARRCDRLRVVCSQPYNKHCKYGLSFIQIYEPEGRDVPASTPAPTPTPTPASAPALPSAGRLLGVETFSSDDDEFSPGELFAKHIKSPISATATSSTDAQIRQATSHALKNIPDSATKLTKTPINKAGCSRGKHSEETHKNRQRDNIMYTDDDERPHAKIDRVVNRHKDEKSKENEDAKTKNIDKTKDKEKLNSTSGKNSDNTNGNNKNHEAYLRTPSKDRNSVESTSRQKESASGTSNKKRKRDTDNEDKGAGPAAGPAAGPVCGDPSRVLRGVVFALSGYANPRRAALRAAAAALGALYRPDWARGCTHLVCAFPNTPKLRTVRKSSPEAVVVTGEWIEQCELHRRRVPWQWYATEPAKRLPATPLSADTPPNTYTQEKHSDEDTDDEIERVLRNKKRKKESPTRRSVEEGQEKPGRGERQGEGQGEGEARGKAGDQSHDSDVAFVCDERFQGHVTLHSDDDHDHDHDHDDDGDGDGDATDREDYNMVEEQIDTSKSLPAFFEGYTFVVPAGAALARYVRAYGGLVLHPSEVLEDSEVHFWLGGGEGGEGGGEGGEGGCVPRGAKRVRPQWLWRCHRQRRLCSPTDTGT